MNKSNKIHRQNRVIMPNRYGEFSVSHLNKNKSIIIKKCNITKNL